tara:strand:- start:281 stop:853 length:573 start_codon:yes stop_codon:yes gene_type:complete
MKLDLKKNFDFNKIKINELSSTWLTQVANHINLSIQDGLKKATDIQGNRFKSGGEFTHKSVQDGHAHKRPLVRSGRMGETRILRPTPKKLTFKIISGIKKSMKRWNLEVDGSKSSGTRKTSKVNYGKLHNEGYWTSKKSLTKKNVFVSKREWFGIPKPMLPNGPQWFKFAKQFDLTFQKFLTTAMKKFSK